MLVLKVTIEEVYDEDAERFVDKTYDIEMEHSLSSLSKWESFFEKPFLGSEDKETSEIFWYITEAMTITPDVPPEVFAKLTTENLAQINEYINSKQTASWFREQPDQPKSREVITAEIIYHWMISYNIWLECEHWHINKLLALIKVCNHKSAPPKKMSQAEAVAERQRLNAARKAKYKTKG